MQVILDMTTREKVGKFKGLGKLIRVYNGKRGLHLVVLYIVRLYAANPALVFASIAAKESAHP